MTTPYWIVIVTTWKILQVCVNRNGPELKHLAEIFLVGSTSHSYSCSYQFSLRINSLFTLDHDWTGVKTYHTWQFMFKIGEACIVAPEQQLCQYQYFIFYVPISRGFCASTRAILYSEDITPYLLLKWSVLVCTAQEDAMQSHSPPHVSQMKVILWPQGMVKDNYSIQDLWTRTKQFKKVYQKS